MQRTHSQGKEGGEEAQTWVEAECTMRGPLKERDTFLNPFTLLQPISHVHEIMGYIALLASKTYTETSSRLGKEKERNK